MPSGFMYANGHGVPQNYREAIESLRKAANQGYANAQHNLGVMYRDGQGVLQNYVEAVKWFRKAADQLMCPACENRRVTVVF
jgi:TPR repeat protein